MRRNVQKTITSYDQMMRGRVEPFGVDDFHQIIDRAAGDLFRIVSYSLKVGYVAGYRRAKREASKVK